MVRNLLVLVRGPSGSGKSALCAAWAGRAPYEFQLLSTDAIQDRVDHPELSDQDEFDLVLDAVGVEIARLLAVGPLLVDAGLRDPEHLDRALAASGRHRGDPDVLLVRLAVDLGEAVRRKSDLPESRVRELHEKWQTRPVAGEFVLETSGLPKTEIERRFGRLLSDLVPPRAAKPPPGPYSARGTRTEREAP